MWMMVVTCNECHGRNFVAAVLGDGDPDEAQLALRKLSEGGQIASTPRRSGEAAVSTARPVSVDDVIDMHEFLAGFDGDFELLFARRKRPAMPASSSRRFGGRGNAGSRSEHRRPAGTATSLTASRPVPILASDSACRRSSRERRSRQRGRR
jgi:hypothetical protein